MTSNNRRHLARVRSAFLGATALAGFAAIATPASAIVINDNFTTTQDIDTQNVNGIGQMVVDEQNGFIGLCTATLINPRTVIFASHCVNENPSETAFMPATGYGAANGGLPIGFFFNVNNNAAGNSAIGQWLNGVSGGPKDLTRTGNNAYNSNFVVYNTNCCTIGLGNNFLQSDIAMAALDTPAIGIPTWTLLFSALTAPTHATITGYGDNGIGSTGQGTIDFKRRVAENLVSVLGSLDDQDTFLFGAPDGLPANLYMLDFNDPKFNTAQANQFDFNIFHDQAYTNEGITAPGDSGGPLIIDQQFAAPTIAAVLSGGDRFYNAQPGSSYGTTSFYQPLYLYWDWIIANNPYKYVTSTAGNHNWTDANAFVMALDPAYLTIDSNGNTINALPTTPAAGAANIAPGFGEVCYFNDCINIVTGVETNPTPAAPANPGQSGVATGGSTPFGGALGIDGFRSLVESMVASGGVQDCGAALVSVDALNSDDMSATAQSCASPQTPPPGGGGSTSPQSNWLNPEGTALVNGVAIQGAPGASPGQLVTDTNANVATLNPARYYDVTIAAAGTITLQAGTPITIDNLTINGPTSNLTIANGASLTTLIGTDVFAGNFEVDGTYNAPNGVAMFGGLLQGTGTVNGNVGFLLSAVAPGTNGTIGTLTVNGNVSLGTGSTTLIDVGPGSSDLLRVNGAVGLGGTLIVNFTKTIQMTDSFVFLTATGGITGSYDAVTDTLPGVLFPVVSTTTVGPLEEEVLSFQAGSFVALLGTSGTPDQIQVATALDAARGSHYNDLLALYQAIDPLSGGALSQALEDLAPDAERTAPLVGDMETTGFDNMIWQHLAGAGPSSGGTQTGMLIDSEGLKMALASAGGNSAQSQQLVAMGMGIATNPGAGNTPAPVGTPAAPEQADDSWMMLPNGAGGFLSGSSLSGSVAVGGGGGRADVRGLIVGGGLDMPVGDGFTVGATFGYSDATATLRAMPSTLQSDAIQGAIYARYDWGNNYIVEGFASYGHQTIETRRAVVVGPTTFLLSGHSGGDSPSGGVYFGRSFDLATLNGATLNIVPSASLQFLSSSIDAFTETGGAPAMSFAGFTESSALSRLGIDASMKFDLMDVAVTPNLHLFWVDNFAGNNGSIQSVFAAGPSSIMTFAMAARDRSYGEMGLGLDIDLGSVLGHDATLSGRYDGNTRDDVQYGAWTG
ncbi:MAG TPA: autotransporter outer membrane beta-barrel domain-containing protein, partial [Rhizomicrobium sp.]|nr:autotransporter outer membrane beta-barrel domain-containing protein [Rhizomicrobium sp.]